MPDNPYLARLTTREREWTMPKLTDRAIYPRFEFRLSHEEKAWLTLAK